MDKVDGLTKLGSKTKYQYEKPGPQLLETFENKHPEQIYLVPLLQLRDEFTSLCPITGQPDHARMEVIYVPNARMVESKALKLYFFAFRNQGEFHEDVINRMVKDLWSVLEPKYLRIFGEFAPRGGLAIRPLVERWQKELGLNDITQIRFLVETWDRKDAKR